LDFDQVLLRFVLAPKAAGDQAAAGDGAGSSEAQMDGAQMEAAQMEADDAYTARVAEALQRDGRLWAGPALYRGRAVLRVSVCSWRTTAADMDAAALAIKECACATEAGNAKAAREAGGDYKYS
jgi:hypothetical protein